MKSIYYREQKHICGKNYDTAPYMEVDLYPVTPKQHKASRRAKRKEASTLAQQTYNDNRAKRYHVQLVNANFGKSAFLAQRFMPLTDAEALAIRWHMGAYDDAAKGGSKVLSAAMAATPLVYALHAADMRAEQKENAQQ